MKRGIGRDIWDNGSGKDGLLRLMSRKRSFFQYTILFVLVFVGAFLSFFVRGKSFVWKSDGYRQYFPALRYLISCYRNLNLPMVDYSVGQGEDVITTFANYGLGDPFSFLAALLPSGGNKGEYVYGFLTALRLYCSGAAFWGYCEGMKQNRRMMVYGALTYSFCGFALWSVKDPFFLNAMIYLPFVLLGIEWVLKKRNPLLLVFSVFFSIMSSYYFFYMIVIAAVCYFVSRCVMKYGWKGKVILQAGIRCIVVALGGVMMSGALLLPCVYAYLHSSRGENYVSVSSLLAYPFSYYKNMFLHLFTITENDDAGAVSYVSMAVALLLVTALLMWQKEKKYRVLKFCVVFSFLAVASPLVGYIFNGFGYVTNRFMFIPAFLLSLVLVLLLPALLELDKKDKYSLCVIAIVYVLGCCFVTSREGILHTVCMAILLGLTLAVLCVGCLGKWRERLFCVLLGLNLVLNGNLLYSTFGTSMSDAYMKAGTVQKAYQSPSVLRTLRSTKALERFDVMTDRGENPNRAVTGASGFYSGISVYYSVIHSGYAEYMMSMENTPDLMFTHRILGNDGRTIMENLSNVRYVVAKEEALVPYGYEKVGDWGKEKLYENCCPTSIGYTYDSYVSESAFDKANVFERQETLLHSVVPEKGSKLEQEMEKKNLTQGVPGSACRSIPFEMSGVKSFEWGEGKVKVKKKNGTFQIPLKRKNDCEYYLRLSGLKLEKSDQNTAWANVSVGNVSKSFLISDSTYDFYFGRNDYLIHLGVLRQEEKNEMLSFRLNGPAVYSLDNIELVEVPVAGVASQVKKLNEESLRNVRMEPNGFSGTLEVSKEKVLCLAVPYSEGYTLFVDGKEVPVGKVNKMYIGALISPGKHDILLKYSTPLIKEGIILTVLGILYTIILCILYKKYCNKSFVVV